MVPQNYEVCPLLTMHKTCSINYGHLANLQKTLPTTDLNKKKHFHLIKYLLATFIFFPFFSICTFGIFTLATASLVVRRAGLLWSQQDFKWRWSVPLFKCLTVLEFSFILFDLCLLITFFNFIMNYVPIVTFWIFTYHKIWILSIMFCFIWSYWIIYFLACLEVSWRVVS